MLGLSDRTSYLLSKFGHSLVLFLSPPQMQNPAPTTAEMCSTCLSHLPENWLAENPKKDPKKSLHGAQKLPPHHHHPWTFHPSCLSREGWNHPLGIPSDQGGSFLAFCAFILHFFFFLAMNTSAFVSIAFAWTRKASLFKSLWINRERILIPLCRSCWED